MASTVISSAQLRHRRLPIALTALRIQGREAGSLRSGFSRHGSCGVQVLSLVAGTPSAAMASLATRAE